MTEKMTQTGEIVPRAYTIAEFCQLYRISNTQTYREIAAGRLTIRKMGVRSLIARDDAEAWFAALPVTKNVA